MYAPKTETKIKTACELGLRAAYWRGLWEVLYKLEQGWFEYEELLGDSGMALRSLTGDNLFNMQVWHVKTECGTIGCIGGWAAYFGGVSGLHPTGRWMDYTTYPAIAVSCPGSIVLRNNVTEAQERAHERLTCPPYYQTRSSRYTPARCAPVLRRYLETGEVNW